MATKKAVTKKAATTKTRVAASSGEDTKRVPVSEGNIRKAALRLLNQNLVSTEVQYVQRVLGASATQQAIDDNVIAVRKMVWASIAPAD
jgi:hypothetical protein